MTQAIKHIARKIKELRKAAGMNQTGLAKLIAVTPNTISRWENGTYKPKIDDLERLARVLNQPIWVFLPSDVEPPTEAQRALLSATGDLPAEDLAELARYADFVRARKEYRRAKK
jgi:transcriptional regulator with XRE-family HTH domain